MERSNTVTRFRRGTVSRRQVVRAGISLSLGSAAAGLVACGGGTTKPAPATSGAARSQVPAASAAAQPSSTTRSGAATPQVAAAKYGGTLPLPHTAEAITLDPHTQESYASQYPVMLATSGLLWQMPKSAQDPTDWEITGDLADSFEQADSLTYVFKLHPGVKFHNLPPVSGRELTANDIKYNFERIATNDPKFRMRSQFQVIDKIEAVDKLTVKMTMKQPSAAMTYNFAYPWANMLAHEVVEAGDVETRVIGTGPWMMTKWAKDVGLSYERHPDYFKKDPWTGAKLPYTDKLELIAMFDISTQIAAMRAGKIAILGGGPDRRKDIKSSNPNLVEGPELVSISIANVMMNTQQKPFDDVRVRQAVMWASERSSYWLSVANEGRATGPMSAGTKPWRLPDEELPKIPDLTKAKQLLAAAGYANGLEITSSSTTPYNSPDFTEVTKGQLAKIGIKLSIQQLDNATWLSKVYRGQEYQTSSYSDYAFDDPDRGLYDYYHSKGGANHTNLRDAEVDALLDKQRTELDFQKRREIVLQVQRRLLELSPRVWLYNAISRNLYQPWFKGYREEAISASGNYRNYQFSWVDKA